MGPTGRLTSACCAIATAFVALSGCASRTVPLPPPEVTQVSGPDASGQVTVSGWALQGAFVSVLNENTEQGTISIADGDDCSAQCPFVIKVGAETGHDLRVWQSQDTPNAIFPSVTED